MIPGAEGKNRAGSAGTSRDLLQKNGLSPEQYRRKHRDEYSIS